MKTKYYRSKKGVVGSYEYWQKDAKEFYKYIGYCGKNGPGIALNWFDKYVKILGLVKITKAQAIREGWRDE